MFVSIVIPTFNEAEKISGLISYLKELPAATNSEIIVSDGGSSDATLKLAKDAGAKILLSPVKGRAGQLNHGVKQAKGEIFYFVHADTIPTYSCLLDIQKAVSEGIKSGSFRSSFDSKKFFLKINAFFTRYNSLFLRGGDQSIFVTKETFSDLGGFDENYYIMEDYDFLARLWQVGKFKLIPKATLISARKYEGNSWLRVQLANWKVVRMFKKGASQDEMLNTYQKMIHYRKNAF